MSSNVFDVSNSILKMSPSQKASIIEGIQKDIDIGDYGFKAKSITVSEFASENLVSTSLIASKGLLYGDDEGKIASLDNVFEYDTSSNTLNIMSSNVFDVSNSILKMSPSQKASIIEGIQQNIDIGKYNIKAENMISNSLVSSNTGLLYGDDEGKIVSLDNVFEYDTSSNTLNIMSSNVFDVSN